MSDLVTWLRARLDEDERIAKAAFLRHSPNDDRWAGDFGSGMKVRTGAGHLVVSHSWPNEIDHIARWDPARVLAEVEAKRRILDVYEWQVANPSSGETGHWYQKGGIAALEGALRSLAAVYADRPGYDPAWRVVE